jgi:molybdopterin molybdotransferase
MIEIEIAQKKVISATPHPKPVKTKLENTSGLILAEDIISTADIPPFDRATMDGFAIRAEDSRHDAKLEIIGTIAAGEIFNKPVLKGQAVRIMTGAPVPESCDAVVPVESTSEPEPGIMRLSSEIDKGKNIAIQGEEISKGHVVLKNGSRIDSVAAAVAAQIGRTELPVYPKPSVTIIATGSELVEPNIELKPGQIRDSNSFCLLHQCHEWNAEGDRRLIVADKTETLQSALKKAINDKPDMIVITGGVSVGEFDLVPDTLKKLGVNIIFHNVAQKPGKPMLFGTLDNILIFGLPGNPVAAYLCFELYVGPSINHMMGEPHTETKYFSAIAEEDFKVKSDRAFWHASYIKRIDNNFLAYPVATHGSADIFAILKANAFARFEAGTYLVPAGEEIRFFMPRGKSFGT